MKDTIMNLMSCYKDFLFSISEYTIVNETIKSKMKSNREKVEFYSLEIKSKNYSRYSTDITKYLLNNKLDKFLERQIDDNKIKELTSIGILNESMLEYFIDKEHTRLIINSSNIQNEITKHKNTIRENITNIGTLELIRRREFLRLQTNENRIRYFNAAKATKDILVLHYKDKITFKTNSDVVRLEIKIINTTYKDEFIHYLDANNIDAFKYKVLDTKLNNSKDKRLDASVIAKYRIDNRKECLYITVLPGAFKKYKEANKKS